ncbi:MAG: 2-oxoacid:acceptor oxidoreductase subunit alpha [Chloroflexi bacterium]|nr:2-oxoacid:acceptor oxidoreductase subunit alpha [Chloroflexota bacterium]
MPQRIETLSSDSRNKRKEQARMCALNIGLSPRVKPADDGFIYNDFAFTVATKNGSGSQTSNNTLVYALFKMGIPVNGKNLFPSNIKGLPTWYTIRVSKDGYTARKAVTEICVAFNQDTAAEDISKLPSGGVCILPSEWNWGRSRDDITYYEIPVKDLVKSLDVNPDFRDRMSNMVYVGAIAELFDIPQDKIYTALLDSFKGKTKPADMNMAVVKAAAEWTREHIAKQDPYKFAPLNLNGDKIVITGNESAALGAIFGGVTVVAWYPITPSTSIIDTIMGYQHLRRDPDTGKETIAVIQAEDEIAAIGMLVGAGWAGARAMTSTSGPGISLMAEFTGLAYYAEIPIVVWDVTRMGPSTGLPTRTSQGDLIFTYFLGHGDSRQLILLPGSVEECFEFGWRAFDIAEAQQTPVFVLSDLDIGMNNWMAEPFSYPTEPLNRGKVLNAEQLQQHIEKFGTWGRYKDVDGDAVGYRTIPGTDHSRSAYFLRGTGHNEMAVYSERSDDWLQNMGRLHRKFENARTVLPAPVTDWDKSAPKKVGIVTLGSNEDAIREARDWLAQDGVETDYLRVRALPLHPDVLEFNRTHEHVIVIENNFDGQLNQVINIDIQQLPGRKTSLPLGDSLPMTPDWVYEQVTAVLK